MPDRVCVKKGLAFHFSHHASRITHGFSFTGIFRLIRLDGLGGGKIQLYFPQVCVNLC